MKSDQSPARSTLLEPPPGATLNHSHAHKQATPSPTLNQSRAHKEATLSPRLHQSRARKEAVPQHAGPNRAHNAGTAFTYDGMERRTQEITLDGEGDQVVRDLYCSASWQVLEERVNGVDTVNNIYSPVYANAIITRDDDPDGNRTLDRRINITQDANFNSTTILDSSGSVLEHFVYLVGGIHVVTDDTWTVIGSDTLKLRNTYQGGREDAVTGDINFQMRDYNPRTLTWNTSDPIQAGMNWYEPDAGNPINAIDPSGLKEVEISEVEDNGVGDATNAAAGTVITKAEIYIEVEPCSFNSALAGAEVGANSSPNTNQKYRVKAIYDRVFITTGHVSVEYLYKKGGGTDFNKASLNEVTTSTEAITTAMDYERKTWQREFGDAWVNNTSDMAKRAIALPAADYKDLTDAIVKLIQPGMTTKFADDLQNIEVKDYKNRLKDPKKPALRPTYGMDQLKKIQVEIGLAPNAAWVKDLVNKESPTHTRTQPSTVPTTQP